jgi:hypothetical protein
MMERDSELHYVCIKYRKFLGLCFGAEATVVRADLRPGSITVLPPHDELLLVYV